jgi:repressor LexA
MPKAARSTEDSELTALRAIQKSLHDRGYPPSQREISASVGWASPSGANNLLRLMEARGLIEVAPGIPRGLRVTDAGHKMIAHTEAV